MTARRKSRHPSSFRMVDSHRRQLVNDAKHAALRGGREICGLLISNGYLLEPIRIANQITKGGGFIFSAPAVREVIKAVKLLGHEVVGTYHSHPYFMAKPGESDIAGVPNDSLMLIVDVQDRKVALWHVQNLRAQRVQLRCIR